MKMKMLIPFYAKRRKSKLEESYHESGSLNVVPDIRSSSHDVHIVNVKKFHNEYKTKYLASAKENLRYEKKLIQLNTEISRLKLDLNHHKERADELNKRYVDLKELYNNLQQRINDAQNDNPLENLNYEDLTDFKRHETFLLSRANLDDQICHMEIELSKYLRNPQS